MKKLTLSSPDIPRFAGLGVIASMQPTHCITDKNFCEKRIGTDTSVTRKDRLGEEGEGWHPEQKIKMDEAINNYTLGAAYSQFMENRKGMIKTGFLADIVILDKNLLVIPENEIMKTKVDYTVTGGKIVYFSGN